MIIYASPVALLPKQQSPSEGRVEGARGSPGPLSQGPGLLLSVQTEAEWPLISDLWGKMHFLPRGMSPKRESSPNRPSLWRRADSSPHQPGSGQPRGVTERTRPHPSQDCGPPTQGVALGGPCLTGSFPRCSGGRGGRTSIFSPRSLPGRGLLLHCSWEPGTAS